MSNTLVLNPREKAWNDGKRFFSLFSGTIPGSGNLNVVGCLNDADAIIEFVDVTSDAASLTWQTFAQTQVNPITGTPLLSIPRNSEADRDPSASVTINPTINNDGIAFGGAVELIAQAAAGGRNFIKERIIAEDFFAKKDECFLIRFVNGETSTQKISLVMSYRNE